MTREKHWMADLLGRVLPIWRGQIAFAHELTESTIMDLTVRFSEMVKELNRVREASTVLANNMGAGAQEGDESSVRTEIEQIKKLIKKHDAASAIEKLDDLEDKMRAHIVISEKSMQEIALTNDRIKKQIESVLVDFQFQDKVSQVLRQVVQAQSELVDVVENSSKSTGGNGAEFDVEAWLADLQARYVMEDQVRIHTNKRQSEVKTPDDITFF